MFTKKIITSIMAIFLSASMIVTPALAEEISPSEEISQTEEDTTATGEDTAATEEDTIATGEDTAATGNESLSMESLTEEITLQYDDQYDTGLTSIQSIKTLKVSSYIVRKGKKQQKKDYAVLTDCGNGTVRVTGIGSASITGLDADGNSKTILVTAEAAPLTVIFLNGQSNAEGIVSEGQFSGAIEESVACEDGEVYSTYVSQYMDNKYDDIYPGIYMSQLITGVDNFLPCDPDSNLAAYIPYSLSAYQANMSGTRLNYHLNALTVSGDGKTGPDSGIAYEWNKLTGDKVWVVNTAWSGSSVSDWQAGGSGLELTKQVGQLVDQVLDAEIAAGHYTLNKRLDVWMQGEGDTAKTTDSYLDLLASAESELTETLNLDYFGIITARRIDQDAATAENVYMTGFKNADYIYSALQEGRVGVVSNVNDCWITDQAVQDYFARETTEYPTQSGDINVPSSITSIHGDAHFSQVAHNANGISAAKGLYAALYGHVSDGSDADKDTGYWMSLTGTEITSLDVYTDLPMPLRFRAGCTSDDIVYTASSPNVTYDPVYGTVTVSKAGEYTLTAINNTTGNTYEILLNVQDASDGLHRIRYTLTDYVWYCTKDGHIHGNDIVKNGNAWYYVDENGTVDFDFNGFASNANGTWYFKNGRIMTEVTGLIKDLNTGKWCYLKGGKLQTGQSTIVKNAYGWWYVGTNGFVDFTYNGMASNANGTFKITAGKVTFTNNGVIKVGSTWYYLVKSKVTAGPTVQKNSMGWWYIDRTGKVDFTFTGIASNANGRWYCQKGKVQFSYSGKIKYNGTVYKIVNGKVV